MSDDEDYDYDEKSEDYDDDEDEETSNDIDNYIILRGIRSGTDEGDIIASLPNYDDIVKVDVFDIHRFAIVKYRNKSSAREALINRTLTIKNTTVTVDIPTTNEILTRHTKKRYNLLDVRKQDGDQAFLNDMALVGLEELVDMTRYIHHEEGPSDMYHELIRMIWRYGRMMKFEFDNLRLRLVNQLLIHNLTYKQYKQSLTYYLISQLTGENFTQGKPIKRPNLEIFNFNMKYIHNKSNSGLFEV